MKLAKCVRLAAGIVAAATFMIMGVNASPQATAENGMVEVYFCVVDQAGKTIGSVPVQLEFKGADGLWYVQQPGNSASGCTSFYRQPAPATYRVSTVAANTGACQGATPEAFALPGPQLNIGNLALACVIQPGPPALGDYRQPAIEAWFDYDLDGVRDELDRWPGDSTRS